MLNNVAQAEIAFDEKVGKRAFFVCKINNASHAIALIVLILNLLYMAVELGFIQVHTILETRRLTTTSPP
jgi:hypothetical protein